MILFRIIATVGYGLSVTAPSACNAPATLNASSVPDLRMYRSFWTLTVAKSNTCFSGQMRSSFTRPESSWKAAAIVGLIQSRITATLKVAPCSLSLVLPAVVTSCSRLLQCCYNKYLSFLLHGNGVIPVVQLGYLPLPLGYSIHERRLRRSVLRARVSPC